ncbi:hypothetical protein TGAM01_v204163 [Trichoderma gamsii]|uniref:Uncharacterized protein n=1 Tax=Trichoderma gamsii TaxID=398673 RepID=A0A2P4ZSE6_9HYPO|nr:hypothetical protein TGAM01_v204163 [Trichoderma gamsii]PON27214.1 hypothetical protein TGAM01_v204163 [Trichoderma gamsii]
MASTMHLRQISSSSFIRTTATSTFRRSFHQTIPRFNSAVKLEGDEKPDQSKESQGNHAPQPKISNLSMPGVNKAKELTKEQKEEVRQHNKDFEEKFDHGHTAPDDKVDKKFWEAGEGNNKS